MGEHECSGNMTPAITAEMRMIRAAERDRILALARARRAQYVVDGWQEQADVITRFMSEIEK